MQDVKAGDAVLVTWFGSYLDVGVVVEPTPEERKINNGAMTAIDQLESRRPTEEEAGKLERAQRKLRAVEMENGTRMLVTQGGIEVMPSLGAAKQEILARVPKVGDVVAVFRCGDYVYGEVVELNAEEIEWIRNADNPEQCEECAVLDKYAIERFDGARFVAEKRRVAMVRGSELQRVLEMRSGTYKNTFHVGQRVVTSNMEDGTIVDIEPFGWGAVGPVGPKYIVECADGHSRDLPHEELVMPPSGILAQAAAKNAMGDL